MQDVPFVISAMFSKTVQTAPYESEKAEISAQCKVDEGADAQTTIEATMSMVRKQVMIALGKEAGTLVAVATDPQKRGPGRPPKVKDQGAEPEKTVEKAAPVTQVIPDKEVEKAAQPAPKPDEDDDFGDPAEKVSEITDKMLQEACASASKKPGMDAAKVKKLFNTKYGTTLVAKIKPEERQAFLDDLAETVKANAPKE